MKIYPRRSTLGISAHISLSKVNKTYGQMKKSESNGWNKFQVLFYGLQAVKRSFISLNGW